MSSSTKKVCFDILSTIRILLRPLGSWLTWIWLNNSDGLDANIAFYLRKTSKLFKRGLVLMSVTLAMFYFFISYANGEL